MKEVFIMKEHLLTYFFRYTAISSQSNAAISTVPSSAGQNQLANVLKNDLAEIGLIDLSISPTSVLTGFLPANLPEGFHSPLPKVGFIAHLDTVDIGLSPYIHPQVIEKYNGKDICLNKEKKLFMKVSEHPELKKYIGQDILFSDGTSVLGADNKAAIASLLTALETLHDNKTLYHGDLYFAFVPDEEIGLRGAKTLDFTKFPVDFAYTLDCCALGEVVYETFNAGDAAISITGVSAHPMSAKNVLVNPTLIAVDFINLFDRLQTPENTDGTDGYIWVKSITSNQRTATVTLNIRDHDKSRYEARKKYIDEAAAFIRQRYPRAAIGCTISDTYGNIADALTPDNRQCIDYIYAAMKNLNIIPKTIAMRGGTDGSFISTKGIPTPNFFTGAHNFHSSNEFLPLDSFQSSCQMILEIIKLIYKKNTPAR
jgi:tripeptide aminopeptidase